MLTAVALVLAAASVAACGSEGDEAPGASSTTLSVYAASSLTGVFTELGKAFEAEHDGVKVAFNFGGSADLVAQIQQGAPADVFAPADGKNMAKLTNDGLAGQTPEDFASNTLEIVTPPDNPARITSLADLVKNGLALVICAPEVPCGSAAVKVEEAAGLDFKPVSEEQNVKDVLAKVTSGEADAGLVYVTDVRAAGTAVHGITFPEAASAVNVYPITTVKGSEHLTLAEKFVSFILGEDGQAALAEAGFAKP